MGGRCVCARAQTPPQDRPCVVFVRDMPKRNKDDSPPPFVMRTELFTPLMSSRGNPYTILYVASRYQLVAMAHIIGVPLYQLYPPHARRS